MTNSQRETRLFFNPDWEGLWRRMRETNPEMFHYRLVDNNIQTVPCVVGGDKEVHEVWGQYVTSKKEEVGCPSCLEWLHA